MTTLLPLRIIATASLSLATGASAIAALPPNHQRAREITAILESREVQEVLRGAPIDSIAWIGVDRYMVKGERCGAEVKIVDTSQRGDPPGPRKFRLNVKKPVCR
ncbi:MAG TPA: hypothetical protein VN047_00125 [Sphingopyxis sp.]|uniref:hypothetical protein n=1 Tax=Sphingopyxis sp. TaxID=1908224 RepID=UPI002BCC910F|nr:hypothetical protein [Sphingopyxis sp.]HWW55275.1 hypothetical protein [Sphingopyxis sp.]